MTPKEQFLETAHAEAHAKLVQTDAFREALNYAMLEFMSRRDFGQAELAVTAAKISGAQDFCAILKRLATKADDVPRGTQPPSLNHDAYDPRRRTG